MRDQLERTKTFVGSNGVSDVSAMDHIGFGPDAFRMAVIRNSQNVMAG